LSDQLHALFALPLIPTQYKAGGGGLKAGLDVLENRRISFPCREPNCRLSSL
jgi:hypothetical protein